MIKGLHVFESYFQEYKEQYILIGGTACDLLMDEAGLEFRATKDLDLVLCAEALSEEFVKHFWEFIHAGGYEIKQKSNGDKCFYRFAKPAQRDFPYMLELFSRNPKILGSHEPGGIAPMAVEDEIVSLSAILMDEEYYKFIINNKSEVSGIMIAPAHCLIPLKIRAWLDLNERMRNNEKVDSRDIRKHRNDIFRLSQLLTNQPIVNIPTSIINDIMLFVSFMRNEEINFEQLGIKGTTIADVLDLLSKVYCDISTKDDIA
jgi:hypothetical protein